MRFYLRHAGDGSEQSNLKKTSFFICLSAYLSLYLVVALMHRRPLKNRKSCEASEGIRAFLFDLCCNILNLL